MQATQYCLTNRFALVITMAIVANSVDCFAQLSFQHHFGDANLQGRSMGQTDLADLDRDGDLEFITGEQRGRIFWYEFQSPGSWVRHELGTDSPSDVGGAALDVNRDGWDDFVTGGAWYENTTKPRQSRFERHVFDAELAAVHDIVLADIDGDGQQDVVTMSDKNDLRWYSVSPRPGRRWIKHTIGESVHSGVATGDLDSDGDVDVVRSNIWFENQDRGTKWRSHKLTEPWGAATPPFAVNATQTEIADINADGRPDVVICDGENPNSKIAWLEAPTDPISELWLTHHLPRSDAAARGALHSLKVADFDLDGDVDIFTVEMERFAGEKNPRWFIWENTDAKGTLVERVILDANLGGHEAVCGDVDGDGDLDICAKPWSPRKNNALGGKSHFDFLENLAADRKVQVTLVDDEAIGYATFQSHNQKVIANQHGIFMTHLRTRDEPYMAQTWRLSRSQDHGQSFYTIHEDTHPTNPPVLETDSAGNVYLMRVDFKRGDGALYRFLAADGFARPAITHVPRAAAGKYAMLLDGKRARLYFFAHNNTFHRLRFDGNVVSSIDLLTPGKNAVLQYPLLALDDAGRLHAAWTTQKRNEYLYWDIHHMVSDDSGSSWHNLNTQALQLPVVADDTGRAMRITQNDEFASHTWLSSVLARSGKLHFLYLAQTNPPRQQYVRYDIASGERDIHVSPKFQGGKIALQGLDGFFVVDSQQPSTMYCVGNNKGHLACLVSRDNGATWNDHARTEQSYHLYSIGGYRTTTSDRWIIGSFTDQGGSNLNTDRSSRVYFFKIPAVSP